MIVRRKELAGFSLIELLVVLGILVILLAILIPVVLKVRRGAQQTKCLANLRTIGQALVIYQNDHSGWAFPVKTDAFGVIGLGLNVPPHERWPMLVVPVTGAPSPPPYDASAYTMSDMREPAYDPAPYTTPVLRCPADDEPAMAHTYVLNNHLADESIRAGKRVKGFSSSEIIVSGEKRTAAYDYYMEWGDYGRVVDSFKHGASVGANYLYLDGHAAPALPDDARRGIDPWDPTKG
ncbi:MAG: prepilin-type N-terminal cleavage/methylation domain-containing protein [Planctomycetota bacterium]|nr:prepilin-type N-terminal cleavage/methylation domain-containing protein [Planctomycetota bacterium]